MTREEGKSMNDSIQWRRPAGCESSGCPEVRVLRTGRIAVRSSKHPHMLVIFDADEFEQLRTGDFGEVTR
jgi:hypothetical protein